METTKTETLAQVAASLELSIASDFVPFSQSRNAKANATTNERSLNWRVTLRSGQRDILTTDYQAGIAHCPAYKRLKLGIGRLTVAQAEAIEYETERGREARGEAGPHFGGAPIVPSSLDVISSLAMDASVLDFPSFEAWAGEYGYDEDSRKAEAIWKACMELALQLRAGLGNDGLERLQQAASEWEG